MTQQGEKVLEGRRGGPAQQFWHRMGAEEEKAGREARLSAPRLDSGEGGGKREKKEGKEQPPRKKKTQTRSSSPVGGFTKVPGFPRGTQR